MEENTPTIDLTVTVQPFDTSKGETLPEIAASSKLTKADAGRAAGSTADEDWLNLTVEASEANPGIVVPKVSVNYHRKVTYGPDTTA